MDNDDYLEFAKEVIDLYEKGEIGMMGELINRVRLTAQTDPSATSPAAMAGYVANLESACFDIYMDFHVSETKNLSPAMKYVWSMGQEIWIKRQNKEAT